jgi:hypothetical protein
MRHIEITDADVREYKLWVLRTFGYAKVANYGILETRRERM